VVDWNLCASGDHSTVLRRLSEKRAISCFNNNPDSGLDMVSLNGIEPGLVFIMRGWSKTRILLDKRGDQRWCHELRLELMHCQSHPIVVVYCHLLEKRQRRKTVCAFGKQTHSRPCRFRTIPSLSFNQTLYWRLVPQKLRSSRPLVSHTRTI
jgi:hypothetical protein